MRARERFAVFPLKAHERPKRMFQYYATGRGIFPFDMLRYDSAWPASGEDAAKLEWERMNTDERSRGLRSVMLRSYREPTVDRWSSFGWSVGSEDLGA